MVTSVELARYENAVDKASADWTLDVTKLIQKLGTDITARTDALRKLLLALPAPKSIDDAEFAKLGERINEINASDGTRLKGLLEMQMIVKVDAKAKRLGIDGYRLKGKVIEL